MLLGFDKIVYPVPGEGCRTSGTAKLITKLLFMIALAAGSMHPETNKEQKKSSPREVEAQPERGLARKCCVVCTAHIRTTSPSIRARLSIRFERNLCVCVFSFYGLLGTNQPSTEQGSRNSPSRFRFVPLQASQEPSDATVYGAFCTQDKTFCAFLHALF